ncbi:MAG: hypothetical protein QM802_06345 [Agriterribacter sp.]
MKKKHWALLILCLLLLLGYVKLFYKTYSEDAVAASADNIGALDVKRITNTIIWNYITTPSQWKIGSLLSTSDKVDWDDMVTIPDYIFVFHAKDQPMNAWYTVLQVKDEKDFEKGLQQFGFERREGSEEFFSKKYGIEYIRNGDRLLVGNMAVNDKQYIRKVADELFAKKNYVSKQTLDKNISAASHFAFQYTGNDVISGIVASANFDKNTVSVNVDISTIKPFTFQSKTFNYSSTSLLSIAFTQPPAEAYAFLTDSAKSRASRLLNFQLDSLLRPDNKYYQLDLPAIITRADSAISYEYDKDFNQVEKVVVNNVQEPSFNFSITGDSIQHIYDYWKSSQQLEQTVAGDLFTPIPFVKSYCSLPRIR